MAQKEFIEEKIDQMKACIHCGMCLPACPTYLITGNEGNSPRGRLYLIKDMLLKEKDDKKEDLNKQAVEYLDNCLNCRACETACPSGVDYVEILEYARNDRKQSKYSQGFKAFIRKFAFNNLLPNRDLLASLRPFISLASLLPFVPKVAKNKLRPYKKIEEGKIYKSDFADAETLSLPLGCVMDTLYNDVHWATITVLNAYGYSVYIPKTACCGSLAYHSGEAELGHRQLKESTEIYLKDNYPLVMNSAGCGSHLKDEGDPNLRVMDLIEALEKAPRKPEFKSLPTDTIATYHPACHLNHSQGIKKEYTELLSKIPNLSLVPLQEADVCCGSAGFYNIIKEGMANEIGKRKADFIEKTGVKVLITANPGCMSQIEAHLGSDYQVKQPVEILLLAL